MRRAKREGAEYALSMGEVRHQMPETTERGVVRQGEPLPEGVRDETTLSRQQFKAAGQDLLVQVLARENMQRAWQRVKANKGSAGVDGLSIIQTAELLKTKWPELRTQLQMGLYRPQPVRRVTIPKPDGSERELGIPTVTDRLIQQALLQVLQKILDPTFSEHSYGFRPKRCAQDAVLAAQRYAQAGYQVVLDVDLSKFFDRVNHDILMDRLSKRIADKDILRLIRSYLLGWKGYFRYSQTPSVWRKLDEWIRHRLRAIQLKYWKRGPRMYAALRKMGAAEQIARKVASCGRSWWRGSVLYLNKILTIAYFDQLGLPRLS